MCVREGGGRSGERILWVLHFQLGDGWGKVFVYNEHVVLCCLVLELKLYLLYLYKMQMGIAFRTLISHILANGFLSELLTR